MKRTGSHYRRPEQYATVTSSRDPPRDPTRLLAPLYAAYSLGLFALLGLGVLVLILPVPWLDARRRMVHRTARLWLWASGRQLQVHHRENLPEGPCIVVANHTSYLDGIVLCAALPPRFGFVIKREMNAVPVAGLLLRRIGSEFVERFNRHKGGTDARRVLRTAASGHSLVFFPEGTFTEEVGLGKFHTGAFAIAARAACPVVPAVILGTRRNMPATRILPSIDCAWPSIARPSAASSSAIRRLA